MTNKKTCFLIGGGASLNSHIKNGLWGILNGQDVWSLNFAFKFMPFVPSRECWVDTSFFKNNITDLQNLSKLNVPLYCKKNEYYKAFTFINQYNTYRDTNKTPILPTDIFIGNMGLVGIFALSLAIYENYETIYLFGYDFGTPNLYDENTHFYQSQVKETKIQSSGVGNPRVYYSGEKLKNSVTDFEYYKQFNREIWNVSETSNISAFPRISYNDLISKLNLTKQV